MKSHYHKVGTKLVECYHQYKPLNMIGSFMFGITVSFPFEHLLWEKVAPFCWLTKWLGL
jgi:hypothetical protein